MASEYVERFEQDAQEWQTTDHEEMWTCDVNHKNMHVIVLQPTVFNSKCTVWRLKRAIYTLYVNILHYYGSEK